MTRRPAKPWHAWGLLCVALFVATPPIPSGAAANGNRAPALLLILTHVGADTDKVAGNIGGVVVVGVFNTVTAKLAVAPKGTKPRGKFLSGNMSCLTGSCVIDGELLGARLAGFPLDAKFAAPFKNSNGYGTLVRLSGSLERLYSDHDAWVSVVTKWADNHLGAAEARARVVAQAAGRVAGDESSGASSPAAAVDSPNGPGAPGGGTNSGNSGGGAGDANGSGSSGAHGGGTTGGTSGGGAGSSGNHGGGGGGGGPHR
ncbi:MAG TPA: hypothetical protein VKZ50_04655 [bacterium]|nr:hypothetical protein [bacterium]